MAVSSGGPPLTVATGCLEPSRHRRPRLRRLGLQRDHGVRAQDGVVQPPAVQPLSRVGVADHEVPGPSQRPTAEASGPFTCLGPPCPPQPSDSQAQPSEAAWCSASRRGASRLGVHIIRRAGAQTGLRGLAGRCGPRRAPGGAGRSSWRSAGRASWCSTSAACAAPVRVAGPPSFTEQDSEIPPERALPTTRVGRLATRRAGRGEPITDTAACWAAGGTPSTRRSHRRRPAGWRRTPVKARSTL